MIAGASAVKIPLDGRGSQACGVTPGTTQQRASIIHGYGATPEDHWFGWLAEQLRADGIPTTIPALPTPQAPDPGRWLDVVRTELGTLDEHSMVVAHSLGCLTVLRHLGSLPSPWRLGTLVLVSGFVDQLPALPHLNAHIGHGCDVTDSATTSIDSRSSGQTQTRTYRLVTPTALPTCSESPHR
ncbi:RBBP9/YdeN family alpha/beta hydrolase [Streptomyces sp. Y7]|uniref:RBBP9/YdeN family alpha/beta hydrolase n=1 Tax=Streptomyces sp. Y7 TaxID=3342392 RepID=UPI00371A787D